MSAGVLHYQTGSFKQQLPHRKPLPQLDGAPRLQTLTRVINEPSTGQQDPRRQQQYQQSAPPIPEGPSPLRTSTMTSTMMHQPPNTIIVPPHATAAVSAAVRPTYNPPASLPTASSAADTRRTLSSSTGSITSTLAPAAPVRMNSAASSLLYRSTSSRSGTAPTSYVALMRKQKATVWCDRAQQEDPRVLAQQRLAKQRAAMEVSSTPHAAARAGAAPSSSITGGVRSKIRHHGAPKAQQYAPAAHPSSGVPMRLSAREVDEGDSDDDAAAAANTNASAANRRTPSGRSSTGSAHHPSAAHYPRTPPSASAPHSWAGSPVVELPSRGCAGTGASDATPVPERHPRHGGYFPESLPPPPPLPMPLPLPLPGKRTHELRGSGAGQDAVDLQRRGSVDERTMTMGRLFVANPDVEG